MNKQTVEEAAADEYKNVQISFLTMQSSYVGGALFGASWQKEQGIDWISVDIKPDVDWHETEDGGSFKISKPLLLWKEGVSPVTGRFFIQLGSHPYYRLDSGNWNPTHWAHLNLPE